MSLPRFTTLRLLFTFTRTVIHRSHKDQRWSWAAHGFVTLLIGLVFVVLHLFVPPLTTFGIRFSFLIGVTLTAAYYIGIREQLDEKAHRKKGDYDTPDDRGITPRVDKAADGLAPAFICMTAWITWFISHV